jgi:hypothetical protein
MPNQRPRGVARVPQVGRVPAARTKPGAGVARVPAPQPATSLLRPDEEPARPVFVDRTGRRRRLLGWLAFVLCCLGLLVVGLLWLSQTGSTVGPGVVPTCPAQGQVATPAGQQAGPSCPPARSGR